MGSKKAAMRGAAAVEAGRQVFASATGRWAGERMAEAIRNGEPLTPAVLRTNDTLRKDEWLQLDDVLVQEGLIRLKGVADLIAAGLTTPIQNAMGTMIYQYERVTDMNPAGVSLSGIDRTELDRVEFDHVSIPLPIVHKDFNINLRTLEASRKRGESLDTTQGRVAGRLVGERIEQMLFQGGPTFGGNTIYGYLSHPLRHQLAFGAGGAWNLAAKTGQQVVDDTMRCIATLQTQRFYGPYWMYVSGAYGLKLSQDFAAAKGDNTIRDRLMKIDGLVKISTVDQITPAHVVVLQATSDVVTMGDGETLQTIQWDIHGGFEIAFKAFAIQIPLIRTDAQDNCGIVDLH
jgi:uncharacterized linocin/CFP29 family protein